MSNKCVMCGCDIPEGRHVCPNCEQACNKYPNIERYIVLGFERDGIVTPTVMFNCGENPSICVQDSYKITKGKDIRDQLERIHKMPMYQQVVEAGYSRTLESEYREWKAHNFLYRLGIFRKRTGSVDLDNNEPKWRRFIYAILSIF